MGRVCMRSNLVMGLSAEVSSILVGSVVGLTLSVLIIAAGMAYVKYKRKLLPQPLETGSDLEDSNERREFFRQLQALRPHAHVFLEMVNDARKQLREVHLRGDNTAASAYKPVSLSWFEVK